MTARVGGVISSSPHLRVIGHLSRKHARRLGMFGIPVIFGAVLFVVFITGVFRTILHTYPLLIAMLVALTVIYPAMKLLAISDRYNADQHQQDSQALHVARLRHRHAELRDMTDDFLLALYPFENKVTH